MKYKFLSKIKSFDVCNANNWFLSLLKGNSQEKCKNINDLKKFFMIVEQSPTTVIITDLKGNIEYVNPKFTSLTGYAFKEVLGKNPRILKSGDQSQEFYERLWHDITLGKEWRGEFHNKKKNGELFWEHASISPLKNARNEITHFIGVKEDITAQKKTEEDLIKTREKLEAQAITLRNSNEQIKILYKELEEHNEKLKKLDRLKSDFVSMVSHELRTPLAITKEGLSLVLDRIPGNLNEKQQDILETSKNNIDRLARIIDDLLDISRIEFGRIRINKEAVDIISLIKQLKETFRVKCEKNNLELELYLPTEEEILVYADSDRVVQVITNLIGNALKFTTKGVISITIEDQGDYIKCAVSDTGVGIAKENLERVFEKFEQAGRVIGPGEKGTGLGLTIAREIVKMHGGRMWVESEIDKGSTFQFTLQKYQSPEAMGIQAITEKLNELTDAESQGNLYLLLIKIENMAKIRQVLGDDAAEKALTIVKDITASCLTRLGDDIISCHDDKIMAILYGADKNGAKVVSQRIKTTVNQKSIVYGKEEFNIQVNFGIAGCSKNEKNAEEMKLEAEKSLIRKRKILIVDDHPQIIRLLTHRIMAEDRFECIDASNGEDAVEKAFKELPDLIICDIMMPKMNGYEVIGRLKESKETKDIPVIILTAFEVKEEKLKAILPGDVPVVSKTDGFDKLVNLVNKLI